LKYLSQLAYTSRRHEHCHHSDIFEETQKALEVSEGQIKTLVAAMREDALLKEEQINNVLKVGGAS
jgi:hypothetical protein